MRNEKAQISIEMVLITGAIMIMAISVYPFILQQSELNKATAAARDGATFGAAMRGMGYSYNGGNEAGTVKIQNLTFENQGPFGDRTWYRIRFYVHSPEYLKDNPSCSNSKIGSSIITQGLRSVHFAFNGEWPGPLVSRVNTSTYSFTGACTWT